MASTAAGGRRTVTPSELSFQTLVAFFEGCKRIKKNRQDYVKWVCWNIRGRPVPARRRSFAAPGWVHRLIDFVFARFPFTPCRKFIQYNIDKSSHDGYSVFRLVLPQVNIEVLQRTDALPATMERAGSLVSALLAAGPRPRQLQAAGIQAVRGDAAGRGYGQEEPGGLRH